MFYWQFSFSLVLVIQLFGESYVVVQDIPKAFDRVWHKELIFTLLSLGIYTSLWFLSRRSIVAVVMVFLKVLSFPQHFFNFSLMTPVVHSMQTTQPFITHFILQDVKPKNKWVTIGKRHWSKYKLLQPAYSEFLIKALYALMFSLPQKRNSFLLSLDTQL